MSQEKWFKYTSLAGAAVQIAGIDIPKDGLITQRQLSQLDNFVGVSLALEYLDPPGRAPAAPAATPDPGKTGENDSLSTGGSQPPKTYEFTEKQVRNMKKADREELCRKVGVKHDQSLDAIIAQLKAKDLLGPEA